MSPSPKSNDRTTVMIVLIISRPAHANSVSNLSMTNKGSMVLMITGRLGLYELKVVVYGGHRGFKLLVQ